MRDRKTESRVFFDELSPKYDHHFYGRHGRAQYRRVVAIVGAWSYSSVLDVGCGVGTMLKMLELPTVKLAGVDISGGMIDQAKKRLGEEADLRVGDSENLPWDARRFDLVVCTDSFHHYPNPGKALSEMRRVLKPGGHVVIADVWVPFPLRQLGNWMTKFGREGDVRVYAESELKKLSQDAGFIEFKRSFVSFSAIVVQAQAK